MAFLTPIAVTIGLILGSSISSLTFLVTILFGFVTFCGAIRLKLSDFVFVISHPQKLFLTFLSAHIISPLFLALALKLLGVSHMEEASGFLLLTAAPIAITSYVWSQILYGNGPLSLAIILIDTLLSPMVTPMTIKLLTATKVEIDVSGMMLSLFLMVVLPSIIGMMFNSFLSKEKIGKAIPLLNIGSKLFLFIVIILNSSKLRPHLVISFKYFPIAIGVIALVLVTFFISYLLGKLFCKTGSDIVSVTIGGCMRNISASLVLAISFFPPEASFPVIFGIIFQQIVVGVVGRWVFKKHIREEEYKSI